MKKATKWFLLVVTSGLLLAAEPSPARCTVDGAQAAANQLGFRKPQPPPQPPPPSPPPPPRPGPSPH